jgi:hypothetical protein
MTNIKKEAKKVFAKGRKKRMPRKQIIRQITILAVGKRIEGRTIKPGSIQGWCDGWLEAEKRSKRK